ncbi:MAG: bifunctional ornithine acetyltransferase/N-acetylglutamate synthase [Elusimicrobia bacterium RIFCSPLOWO2_02_FULL_39_32]|nr:MAG: bifunctional ornithine acetyltransferase/N-acetylglutamate synthase [Elusimicrobia bacterium GWA2_38_7]OGR80047.1 MAG: bifunctional ornithine acetyltransferase/N-acetylglutamate synthase [Elusimicrobia bacterium RIFCSPHIGHO2_02_FULL_39_36]OGR91157.1 MAG: bifunctional ornithine acetyltransferase/N-acetylglutamate synthase [Elusimicrobia bacterium RIFCSPLOWO2_02_FULL_39_32]OGS00125.1 MAG: bifunctional ornithine acetyltransferase/N-acetylglutamate synthase [Elusimicrobia bacterium RIFCSPLOW
MVSDIQLPQGFYASGVYCGIAKKPKPADLTLIYSERICNAAGIFTRNLVKAAPIIVSQKNLESGTAQAIVANSGCANAATGDQGLKDAKKMCALAADAFKIKNNHVLVASTGVIGSTLPIEKIKQGIKNLSSQLNPKNKKIYNNPLKAVYGIMTTDKVPKFEKREFIMEGKTVRLWGCVKGAGMIHPNMATMLSFILTDAELPIPIMKKMLKTSCDQSFNAATVDGDTSTNDSVFFLANGLSAKIKKPKDLEKFNFELKSLCESLTKKMISDGEGATKLIQVIVRGARSNREAKKIAEVVATSPLVKTAFFGEDANWGRILAAAGRSGVKFHPNKTDLLLENLSLAKKGKAVIFSETKAKKILSQKEIRIFLNLHEGKASAHYWTCDFSLDYVKINSDYRS